MKKSYSQRLSTATVLFPGLRSLACLNIAVQAAFPLIVSLTPIKAEAAEIHFLKQPAALSAQRTKVYTLDVGETAASVAKKNNISLDQLRKLNQFRTFARGLNGLQPGDDVDVPLVVAKGNATASDFTPYDISASASASGDYRSEQKAAVYASHTGSFLASSAKSDAAASMARGVATGEVGAGLQQWLSHFGTARVQLNTDKNFSLKNSQYDLLVPLYDQADRMVFTQASLHRTDSRTQANLGAGLRFFATSYMVGGNLFGDYDLSRDHARTGMGVEYWRDFLKLGANGYMHLTGWKQSPELADYQERPANGWDIRAQAWVPSLPQLGGKLTYEQYYGNEVALLGVGSRQKDPHSITAGVNYTPVPLITLGGELRHGQAGENDTRLTLEMNYQLGAPWRTQIDPDTVSAMRSLTGSRHDLVERNNNIVLEYRKKDILRLHTAEKVTGHPGEHKSLGVSVASSHGLSRIDWDAPALRAAGGTILQNGADYAVVLPPYQSSAKNVNSYTVSGVAVDTEGNRSDRSDTQVIVQAPEINKQTSTFTPVSSLLPANGKSVQELTLTVRDANNQVLDIDVNDIILKKSALKSATVSLLARKSAGTYTVTVGAGSDNETVTLTPTVSGIILSPASVTIRSTIPDAGRSLFTASPDTIMADNTSISTLTLVAKDEQGNAMTGLTESLNFVVKDISGNTVSSGVITESTITENRAEGVYTATLKGGIPGKYTIIPEYSGNPMGNLSASVTLKESSPAENTSSIKTDTTTYITGTDMLVTVSLKDKNQKALAGKAGLLTASSITVPNAMLKTGSSWSDNEDGTYTATYAATTASLDNHATLKMSGWNAAVQSDKYTITAPSPASEGVGAIVNGFTFAKDSGFPTTGFTGATFKLNLETVSASDYTWKSDASWVSVTNGVVKFTGEGTGEKVTITGTPINNAGRAIMYSFSLKGWFSTDTSLSDIQNWNEANSRCNSRTGYRLPTVAQISLHSDYEPISGRRIGGLLNEWGGLYTYNPNLDILTWTSDEMIRGGNGTHYEAALARPFITYDYDSMYSNAICRKAL